MMPEGTLSNSEVEMRENSIRLEVAHMLRIQGFNDYHPPDMARSANLTADSAPGRPDLFFLNTKGPTVVVEVKVIEPKARIEPWFDPQHISNNQRKWLDWWVFGRQGQGYIAIGTIFGTPRRLWLIPWLNWDLLEKALADKQSQNMSPPAIIPPARVAISDLEIMRIYECEWKGKGIWELPMGHPVKEIATLKHDKNQYVEKSFRFQEII